MSAVLKFSPAALGKKVDALGALHAELSILKKKAEAIKGELIASGEYEIAGKVYKAVIVCKDSVKLDMKMVKAKLSAADIAACSKSSSSVSVCLFDL